ncbi:AMP-binding protein, partial [uncultured Shewanella sp.]|uniref:AMP-binding protein n=1 Tax=uncultured Shewanella sp. TaxID=173975 RepID=UPI002611BEA3
LPAMSLSRAEQLIIEKASSDTQQAVTETLPESAFAIGVQDNIAVIDITGEYRYSRLKEDSYHIASYLHHHGLSQKNTLIGVLSEKGYKQVISTLGIMLSGAAYLPLHVDWPRGRCDDVLSEGLVSTVLVSQAEYNGCIKGREIESKYRWVVIEDVLNGQ